MNTGTTTALLTPSAIADLAGVTRAAVGNWRRRHDDFPAPAGGTNSRPLYNAEEIRAWLTAHGQTITEAGFGTRLVAQLNVWRDATLPPHELLLATLTLLAIRKTLPERWRIITADPSQPTVDQALHELRLPGDPRDIRHAFERMSRRRPLEDLVRLINTVPLDQAAVVGDELLAHHRSARMYTLAEVDSRASTAMANAVGPLRPDAVVYDPACGIATTLLALDAAQAQGCVRLYGDDLSSDAVNAAHLRALLRDRPIQLHEADSLHGDPHPDLRADIVVCEPSWGTQWQTEGAPGDPRWRFGVPPRSDSTLAWIQTAISHLNQSGRAYVLTPTGVLQRGGASQAIRSAMLQSGCIEAILVFPPKMVSYTGVPTALWVLRPPAEGTDDVLLIDATEQVAPELHVRRWLDEEGDLPPLRRVNILDLVAGDANLLPQTWLKKDRISTADARHDVAVATRACSELLTQVAQTAPPTLQVPDGARSATVKELADAGLLRIERVSRAQSAAIAKDDPRLVSPNDLTQGILPPTPASPESLSEDDHTTHPGTVLFCGTGRLRAAVDPHGGHLHQHWTIRLLPDTARLNPAYLAACLASKDNERFLTGTTIQRADLNQLRIPLPPLQTQEEIAGALARLRELKARAEALSDATDALSQALLTALSVSTVNK